MKYLREFRDPLRAQHILAAIASEVNDSLGSGLRPYRLLEFCGGHTHAIMRHGLADLLPDSVSYVHGPGCPVCILPSERIAALLALLDDVDVTVCCYGDVMRVPCDGGRSLQKAKANGADVRVVYSPLDCISIAEEQAKPVIFFAVGFETTAPATAGLIKLAQQKKLHNLYVYCNHAVTPAALDALLKHSAPSARHFDGILGPSHVSTITGSQLYEPYCDKYQIPIVVAGFEPLDILQSTLMLIRQINSQRCEVENEYARAVTRDGNSVAQELIDTVFELRPDFEWRGLGRLTNSALKVRAEFSNFDAEAHFTFKEEIRYRDTKGCECPAVLRGEKRPQDCKLFDRVCHPENPLGACMVSSEGACAAQWHYQRVNVMDSSCP